MGKTKSEYVYYGYEKWSWENVRVNVAALNAFVCIVMSLTL